MSSKTKIVEPTANKPRQSFAAIQQTEDSNTPDSTTNPYVIEPNSDSKPKNVGIMDAFTLVYTIFGYFAALLVVMVFILITLDLIKYSVFEAVQYVALFLNPNTFNKDTLDLSTLAYYKNNAAEEPYTLYLQQQLISLMFQLGIYFILIFILQLFIFLLLTIISKLKGESYKDNLNVGGNATAIMTVGIAIFCAFLMNLFYNTSFLNSLQPVLKGANENLENIKNYIYDNITTNESFLKSMILGDVGKCVKIMNQQTNTNTIARMIFTLSLYNFYKINISENEEEFVTVIQKIFTPTEIAVRSINPIHYMYYNQNVFLPNLYPILRRYLYGETNAIKTLEKDRQLREDVITRINELNKRLMYLFKLPQKRDSFRNYIYMNWFLITIFFIGIYAIYKAEFTMVINNFVVPYINLVWLMFVGTASPFEIKEEEEKQKEIDEKIKEDKTKILDTRTKPSATQETAPAKPGEATSPETSALSSKQ